MSAPDDDAAAWSAQIDQALCGARDQARLVAAFWLTLVSEGVDPNAASYLAARFLRPDEES